MDKTKALTEGVTQDIIVYLTEEGNTVEESMNVLYNSITFDKLYDSETGLYRESSAYVYELLKDEIRHGKFMQVEV